MGQILLAKSGYPEQVSNKKREIFASYYDKLFVSNAELLSKDTIDCIMIYRNIETAYSESQYEETTQKCMYILYLCTCFSTSNYVKVIDVFEFFLKKYHNEIPVEKRKAQSRYLIESSFRDGVKKYCQTIDFS